jgi:hypothetical protein
MSVASSDKCPSYSTAKNWAARFRTRHLSTKDECSVTIPEHVNAIHSMILDDQRICAKNIAEAQAISGERVSYINHEIPYMRRL